MATFGMILGRRQNILIGNLISAIGTIISATSQSAAQMLASRVIIVCLCSTQSVVVPLTQLGNRKRIDHFHGTSVRRRICY